MDIKEFLLDLYEIELHKKSMYADGLISNKAKQGKELEFAIAIKNVRIIEALLDKLNE